VDDQIGPPRNITAVDILQPSADKSSASIVQRTWRGGHSESGVTASCTSTGIFGTTVDSVTAAWYTGESIFISGDDWILSPCPCRNPKTTQWSFDRRLNQARRSRIRWLETSITLTSISDSWQTNNGVQKMTERVFAEIFERLMLNGQGLNS